MTKKMALIAAILAVMASLMYVAHSIDLIGILKRMHGR